VSSGKPLIDVLTGRLPFRRPIWLMRQAGRYLPEYQKVRSEAGSFLKLCDTPRLAFEVTMQPLRRYDLDAAIVFADILLIARALGCEVDFRESEGPVVSPVQSASDLAKLKREFEIGDLGAVFETISLVRRSLGEGQALIGFCGAPWTVASYIIEGGAVSERIRSRRTAMENPSWFVELMGRLIDGSVSYLAAQVEAGAEALQIFDSWAGDLPEFLHEDLVFAPIQRIIEGLQRRVGSVPVIVFARGLGAAHAALALACRPNAISVEPSVPLEWLRAEVSPIVAVQGNLDPLALVMGGKVLKRAARRITASLPMHGHIFNLGHGVRPETAPEHVSELISTVRTADGELVG
jgi:uroporphyrinogen decarboxylase